MLVLVPGPMMQMNVFCWDTLGMVFLCMDTARTAQELSSLLATPSCPHPQQRPSLLLGVTLCLQTTSVTMSMTRMLSMLELVIWTKDLEPSTQQPGSIHIS